MIISFKLFFPLLVIATFFIGNAKIHGFPIILFLPFLFIPLLKENFRIKVKQLLLISTLAFMFFLYAVQLEVSYNFFYPTWVVSFFLGYIITLIIQNQFIDHPKKTIISFEKIYLLLFLILFIGVIVTGKNTVDGRSSFIFGPNMLYRITIFLSIFVVSSFLVKKKLFLAASLTIASIYMIYMTGSKGGIICLVILAVSSWHAYYNKIKTSNFLLVLIAILLVLTTFMDLDINKVGRGTNFTNLNIDYTDYKETNLRLKPLIYLFKESNGYEIIGTTHLHFMHLFGETGYKYPHNIFLELVVFYGILGIFISMILIYKIFLLTKKVLKATSSPNIIFYYSIFGASIGALFSGDMGDNGVFIGSALAFKLK